jgi:hypothetical protein
MARSRRTWLIFAAFALAGVLLGAVAAYAVRDRSSSDSGQAAADPSIDA